MKQLFALGLLLILFFAACTKTNTVTNTVTDIVHDTTTVIVKDTLTVKDSLFSNFDYITRTTWMFNKYYIGYVDSTRLGTLQYQRGASGNITNYDKLRVTYSADGTINQVNPDGSSLPGTWHFGNDLQTLLDQSNSTGVYDATIVRMDATHFNFVANASDGTVRYGEYIPAQ